MYIYACTVDAFAQAFIYLFPPHFQSCMYMSPKQNGCRCRSNRRITLHNILVVSLCASGLFVMQRPLQDFCNNNCGYDYSVRII